LSQYLAFGLLWLAWLVSWGIAAFWADRAEKRPPLRDELLYRVLLVISAILVFWPAGHRRIGLLWFTPPPFGWTLLVIAVLGIAFAWWARVSLGRLWSGNVTRKAGHHVVDTGPYGLVRHPIYTGLLLALCVTAIDHGTIMALLGAVVATISIVIKRASKSASFRRSWARKATPNIAIACRCWCRSGRSAAERRLSFACARRRLDLSAGANRASCGMPGLAHRDQSKP
jgi:protein-S-isoprenylcysteine O-methyltransferase Ste14